jgi:hypothetical protein
MRWDQQRSNPGLLPLPVQDPVNYALRKCTDGVVYWIPAFRLPGAARLARPE